MEKYKTNKLLNKQTFQWQTNKQNYSNSQANKLIKDTNIIEIQPT